MNSKTLIGGLIGGVVAFLLGWVLYGMLFMDTMMKINGEIPGLMKAQDDMSGLLPLFLGNCSIGLLVSYIFNNWANITTIPTGAKAGALIGALIGLGVDLSYYGTSNMFTLSGIALDVVLWTVISSVAGAAVAWWLGRGAK